MADDFESESTNTSRVIHLRAFLAKLKEDHL
jgi:hypothetical protein